MRGYSTSSVFVSACAGMAFFGVAMLSLAPILGQLNGIVDGANGLPSTMSLGILLGTIVFLWLTVSATNGFSRSVPSLLSRGFKALRTSER